MEQSQWEIIILKPTSVFLSFLANNYPNVDLPELSSMQTDPTAYTIRRRDSEEETLEEIERHFSHMFNHEINRWISAEARHDLEVSFLDFLCSFKFEFHSQIVLMESSISAGHNLLCIKPRSVLIKWMKSSIEDQNEIISILERVNLTHLTENATVVVKNFEELSDVKPFINDHYRPIFDAEMSRMCDKTEQWPSVESMQDFSRYFAVEVYSQLVHLH